MELIPNPRMLLNTIPVLEARASSEMEHTALIVQARLPRIYSRELIDVIFEQPYSRIRHVVEAGIVERQAASRYLKALVGCGILREEKAGREKLFLHPKLLNLLRAEEHGFEAYG